MPRLLPSHGNRGRHPRPRVQHSRYQWVRRRGYVLVRRRLRQPSRRGAYAPRDRLPSRLPLSRPTADASPVEMPVDAQESGTPGNPTIIPDEPMPPRAYFITITTLQAPGWWGAHHVHIEWERAATAADRLPRSQSEDSAVWDPATKSVSFAVIDEDPEEAYIRVFRRLIGRIMRADVIEEDLEDLLLGGRGPGPL